MVVNSPVYSILKCVFDSTSSEFSNRALRVDSPCSIQTTTGKEEFDSSEGFEFSQVLVVLLISGIPMIGKSELPGSCTSVLHVEALLLIFFFYMP